MRVCCVGEEMLMLAFKVVAEVDAQARSRVWLGDRTEVQVPLGREMFLSMGNALADRSVPFVLCFARDALSKAAVL